MMKQMRATSRVHAHAEALLQAATATATSHGCNTRIQIRHFLSLLCESNVSQGCHVGNIKSATICAKLKTSKLHANTRTLSQPSTRSSRRALALTFIDHAVVGELALKRLLVL
jgi:hypothetical protein